MSMPIPAQATADFVNDWNNFQTYITYFMQWAGQCGSLANSLIANPNFSTILTPDQQVWVQLCQTYFPQCCSGTPPQPQIKR